MLSGLHEDTDYVIRVGTQNAIRVFIDDVEFRSSNSGEIHWRPCFYAGRVRLDVESVSGKIVSYWLNVFPSIKKSDEAQFEAMIAAIRTFDASLLTGESAALLDFGLNGKSARLSDQALLSRLRAYGDSFLDAVADIIAKPHFSISAHDQLLPLSQIKKLHHTSLLDRRLLALDSSMTSNTDELHSIQLRSTTSRPTMDTPANQALLALLKRFKANVCRMIRVVQALELKSDKEEQLLRLERRLRILSTLESRVTKLCRSTLFLSVTKTQTTSSGLTQIAALPNYNKAYRLGVRALSDGVEGKNQIELLNISQSWGIYETWCFLAVRECIENIIGKELKESSPRAVSADLAFSAQINDSVSLELLFQGNFPSTSESQGRIGFSISRARRPDIVLIVKKDDNVRALVLDAKWRSGREYILEAMESAHIYHDSLRVNKLPPSQCLLLTPGQSSVPELEADEFISAHGVGVISEFNVGNIGLARLENILSSWLDPIQNID